MPRHRFTQADVAAMAGVSQSTVSFVLNGNAPIGVRISEETRKRVLDAIRDHRILRESGREEPRRRTQPDPGRLHLRDDVPSRWARLLRALPGRHRACGRAGRRRHPPVHVRARRRRQTPALPRRMAAARNRGRMPAARPARGSGRAAAPSRHRTTRSCSWANASARGGYCHTSAPTTSRRPLARSIGSSPGATPHRLCRTAGHGSVHARPRGRLSAGDAAHGLPHVSSTYTTCPPARRRSRNIVSPPSSSPRRTIRKNSPTRWKRRGLQVPHDVSMLLLGQPLHPARGQRRWSGFTVPREEMGARALVLLSRIVETTSPRARPRDRPPRARRRRPAPDPRLPRRGGRTAARSHRTTHDPTQTDDRNGPS